MSTREGHVILNINVLGVGYLPAAWQSPRLTPGSFVDPDYWREIGSIAERGTLDALFLADGPALSNPSYDATGRLEPTISWTNVAAATSRIGLIATASTTFNDPFELAERLLTLDFLSGGRAGWNVVTTRGSVFAENFGLEDVPRREGRYVRAGEFVDVVLALWRSAETGQDIHHHGEHFDVEGRLRVPPSPQGHPVLVQAGGSPQGRALAGRIAEGVFSAELTRDGALEHYRQVKQDAVKAGRSAEQVKILPGLLLHIGSTEEEARRRSEDLHDRGPSAYSTQWLSGALGFDVSTLELDEPFPEHVLAPPAVADEFLGSLGFRESVVRKIRQTNPTVREYLKQTRLTGSGHAGFVGTPEQLADTVEDWFRSGAADGFNLMPDVLPEGLEIIVDEVVPILRRRGLFRHEYAESALRGHFAGPGRTAEAGHRAVSVIP